MWHAHFFDIQVSFRPAATPESNSLYKSRIASCLSQLYFPHNFLPFDMRHPPNWSCCEVKGFVNTRSGRCRLGRDKQSFSNRIISFWLICNTPPIENWKISSGVKGFVNISSRRHGLGGMSRVWLMGSFPCVWYVTRPQLKTLKIYMGWRVSLKSRSTRRGLGRDEHWLTNGIISFRLMWHAPNPNMPQ